MKKCCIILAIALCVCFCSTAFAAETRSIEKINYSKNSNILSGTFETEWSKGTVPTFHNSNVYACMEVMLCLKKNSSANCTVGVGVRKFSGSTGTIVSYAGKKFQATNTTAGLKCYPSSTSTYVVYGDIAFLPSAGTYAYVAKSNGPANLGGIYAGFMSDRLG